LGGPACGIAVPLWLAPAAPVALALSESPAEAAWQGLVEFTIEANAFLYRMARSIVGTLVQVGLGDRSVREFASALNAADRALAGPTAPPRGLCLIQVRYPNDADTEYRPGYRQENE
jgi:tRNA U38,U39,U40 pseudouridine synthase TruA